MSIVTKSKNKVEKEGLRSFVESAWRNLLRRSVSGSAIKKLTSDIFVEKLIMFPRLGYWPHIQNPRSFNEKILYRKLCTNDKTYAKISDKYTVREYVANTVGPEILPELIFTTKDPKEIPFSTLPHDCVIKKGDKGIILFENITEEEYSRVISECRSALSQVYGLSKGEYWYSMIEPRILIEERLYGINQNIPIDYKFFVFDGTVQCIQVDYDRFSEHSRRLYKRDWTPLEVRLEYPLGPITEKPDYLNKMVNVAEQLGSGFDFIRVDLYETRNRGVVFGELTVAPGNGGERFAPREYDFKLGRCWQID